MYFGGIQTVLSFFICWPTTGVLLSDLGYVFVGLYLCLNDNNCSNVKSSDDEVLYAPAYSEQ